MLSRLTLLLALMAFGIVSYAQDTTAVPVSTPVAAIKDLRSGTLIIRLPSNQRKMTALQDALENDDNTNQRAKWLEKEVVI